ncbi:MAG: hypothetical protein LBO75_04750 [Bifidobacteriaceae bacterium]|nr:hypothetical protein [Bifidobacteriaceae bacterium]
MSNIGQALGLFFSGFAFPVSLLLLVLAGGLVVLLWRFEPGRWAVGLEDPQAKQELAAARRRAQETAARNAITNPIPVQPQPED